jgi:hypothetical protein
MRQRAERCAAGLIFFEARRTMIARGPKIDFRNTEALPKQGRMKRYDLLPLKSFFLDDAHNTAERAAGYTALGTCLAASSFTEIIKFIHIHFLQGQCGNFTTVCTRDAQF